MPVLNHLYHHYVMQKEQIGETDWVVLVFPAVVAYTSVIIGQVN